jgi:putative intracellular protease/amidase
MVTTGILLFDDVEELDFAGPWEVLTSARTDGDVVVTVAEHDRPVRSAKGLRVVPDHTFATCPELDVLLVPGGQGTRREDDDVLVAWLGATAPRAT